MKDTLLGSVKMLFNEALQTAISYEAYAALMAKLVEDKSTTGNQPTEALINYTLLNESRMRRVLKKVEVPTHVAADFKTITRPQTWLVLTESWCGDAAHTIPVMQRLSEFTPYITFKIAFRDKHLKLMDAFLTNGTRGIPKLLIWDNSKAQIVGSWGPRPTEAAAKVAAFKAKYGTLTDAFKKELQLWYNKDKGQNCISDLHTLLKTTQLLP